MAVMQRHLLGPFQTQMRSPLVQDRPAQSLRSVTMYSSADARVVRRVHSFCEKWK